MHTEVTLAIRIGPGNPNHHLWNNNGTWFIHYTVYPNHYTAERIRKSLRTKCIREARQRRDELFNRLGGTPSPGQTPRLGLNLNADAAETTGDPSAGTQLYKPEQKRRTS